jgi:hypothetical protein
VLDFAVLGFSTAIVGAAAGRGDLESELSAVRVLPVSSNKAPAGEKKHDKGDVGVTSHIHPTDFVQFRPRLRCDALDDGKVQDDGFTEVARRDVAKLDTARAGGSGIDRHVVGVSRRARLDGDIHNIVRRDRAV